VPYAILPCAIVVDTAVSVVPDALTVFFAALERALVVVAFGIGLGTLSHRATAVLAISVFKCALLVDGAVIVVPGALTVFFAVLELTLVVAVTGSVVLGSFSVRIAILELTAVVDTAVIVVPGAQTVFFTILELTSVAAVASSVLFGALSGLS